MKRGEVISLMCIVILGWSRQEAAVQEGEEEEKYQQEKEKEEGDVLWGGRGMEFEREGNKDYEEEHDDDAG